MASGAKRRSEQRQTHRRKERAEALALLHIDAFELAKLTSPVTGAR